MPGLNHLPRLLQASHFEPSRRTGMPGFPASDRLCVPQEADNRRIALEATGLTKVLGGHRVLRDVELQIAEGETIALMGANGAGKTTLLRCLASLSKPTSGEVRWFGQSARGGAIVRRLVGLAAHESFLYPYLTVRENLLFAGRMYDVPDPAGRADALLGQAGLGPFADRWSSTLSRGMRQRLAVSRALVHDPLIVLLDEPFAGLDSGAADWLVRRLADLRARRRTVCFTTHDPQVARNLAHRILHLQSGRLDHGEDVNLAIRPNGMPVARAA